MSFRNDVRNHLAWSPRKREILMKAQSAEPTGEVYYVDTVNGSAGADGFSWDTAVSTMDAAFDKLKSGDTIFLRGDVEEQLSTPVQVFDVTVIGASNRPRHSDDAPESSGRAAGASWRAPSSPTAETALVEVLQQGWTFANILFDAPSDAAAVLLTSNADSGDDERDASHASFIGCKFVGGQSGIETSGGQSHVLVEDCEFNSLTNAIKALDTSVRLPQYWDIRGSIFMNNTNHVISSFSFSVIRDNVFMKHTTDSIDTSFNSGQGASNAVFGNFLSGTYDNGGGYTETGTDEWAGNFNEAGVTAANPAA